MPSQGKDIALLIAYAAFFFGMYCLVYFVTASLVATDNGPVKWGDGWQALQELLKGLI